MPKENTTKHPVPTLEGLMREREEACSELESRKKEYKEQYKEQYKDLCLSGHRQIEIIDWKLRILSNHVCRKVYGPAKRQVLIAFACLRFEHESKKYPAFTQNDLKEVLWCKYRFFLKEGSKQPISYETLRSDVDKAHSYMNLPIEMLENSRSYIKRVFVELRRLKIKNRKMIISLVWYRHITRMVPRVTLPWYRS